MATVASFGGLQACSSPQVFSERFSREACGAPDPQARCPRARPPSPIPVQEALDDADALRARYIRAYAELSEERAAASASVVVLSALGLYKGVTNPDAHDLAAIGVLGSTAYVWGSAMTSKPRQQAFSAGAQALSCAMATARGYAFPDDWFDASGPGTDGLPGLDVLRAHAEDESRQLEEQLAILRPLGATPPSRIEELVPLAAGQCLSGVPSPCVLSDTEEGRQLYAMCARNHPPCQSARSIHVNILPDPRVATEIDRVSAAQRRVADLVRTAAEQVTVAKRAGDLLWDRSVQIQLKVADQVLKDEPDLDQVKALAQGMRATAFALTSANAFAPTASAPQAAASETGTRAGDGQSGPRTIGGAATSDGSRSSVTLVEQRRNEQQVKEAERIIAATNVAALRLRAKLVELQASIVNASKAMPECTSGVSAPASFKVVPAVTEIQLAPGDTASFTVSGGVGSPGLNVTPLAGRIARHDDVNRTTFDYSSDHGAPEGSKVTLSFIDGSGASRDVAVTIGGDAAAPAPDASSPTGGLSASQVALRDFKALAPHLGLDPTAINLPAATIRKVQDCQQNVLRQSSPDGHRLDADTLDAIYADRCR